MNWTTEQWHRRFVQQAAWTSALREYLYSQVGIRPFTRVLDVGCGTGALSSDFDKRQVTLFGVDLDLTRLAFAAGHYPQLNASCADALHLPFSDMSFDFVICHYLLLWLADPISALTEMTRVAKPGGTLLALAEPDYTARVDTPDDLIPLGKAQTEALKAQGANPAMGRYLPELFSKTGLQDIQFGSSGFQTHIHEFPDGWDLEWQVLENDLALSYSLEQIEHFKHLDRLAWQAGSRIQWVPTFYIMGTKSS